MDIFDQLKRPFPVNRIRWRVGNTNAKRLGVKPWEATEGSALAYIDARDVEQRLDEVVGAENWQCRYPVVESGLVICDIGISVDGEWVWKSNGAGETDIEGKKGACSQALVRAASVWGIGRYLYALPFCWGKLKNGNLDFKPDLPAWATPEGYDAIMAKRAEK